MMGMMTDDDDDWRCLATTTMMTDDDDDWR